MLEDNIWNEMRKEMLGSRLQHDPTLQLVIKAVAATIDKALAGTETKVELAVQHLHRLIVESGKPEKQ